MIRGFKLWLYPDFIFKLTHSGRVCKEAEQKSTLTFGTEILRNIKRKIQDESTSGDENIKEQNFIRALVHPINKLSEHELVDEIKTIIVAAQDTSAIISSTVLLMLAMHKDVQQKVVDKLRSVMGMDDYLNFETLNELNYLDVVIKEAMRLFPVVPFIFRAVSGEVELSSGHVLPAGANVIISIYELHHRKDIWGDDADQFRPERFSRENIKSLDPYAYIPFSKGPRMCIGWKYAILLMKINLALVLMRFEVDTSLKLEDLELQLHVSMHIEQGYKISLKERN